MLAAHRLDGLTAIGLAQDANDFFGAVELFFRGFLRGKKYVILSPKTAQIYAVSPPPLRLRNTHQETVSNNEGHAKWPARS